MKIKEIQKDLLKQLDFVEEVCKEKNIDYSLMCGTLLGAVREKGFIAWDDDVDLIMTRKNYNKFVKALHEVESDEFELDCNDTWVPRVKLKHSESEAFSDVFILDKAPRNIFLFKLKVFILRFLQGTIKKDVNFSNYGLLQRSLLLSTHLLGKPFNFSLKMKAYNFISQNFFASDSGLVHMSNGAFDLVNKRWDKRIFSQYKLTDFEGRSFKTIADTTQVLEGLFGKDYMIPPPIEERVGKHLKEQ